jgi:hypothetical protein
MRKDHICAGCGASFDWNAQRLQFGRAIKDYGLTPAEAKQAMPRCRSCLTELMVVQGRRRISKHEQRQRRVEEVLRQRPSLRPGRL